MKVVERFVKSRQGDAGKGTRRVKAEGWQTKSEARSPKAERSGEWGVTSGETRNIEIRTATALAWVLKPAAPPSLCNFGFQSSSPRHSPLAPRHSSGVALVITLIMLAVITFMAIAFLVLSRGERSSVGTATDQSIARLGADNALERAQIELVAPMIASGNPFSSGLMASTNLINPLGFQGGAANLSIYTSPTNVAYNYPSGQALSLKDMLQNLTNLYINPRPPVFIVTNRLSGASDFRYYIDLNRNGAFEPTGWINVTNYSGTPILDPKTGSRLVDYVQGDPQWIGGLEFPDRHHSADNRFLYRYAYLVVPASQALDINYIHNAARASANPPRATIDSTGADFLRNQGVGPWEINLASFLYDLNTNVWGGRYIYPPSGGSPGNAFYDAYCILTNRYGRGPAYSAQLSSVSQLFANGPNAFASHGFDAYSAGPLMTTAYALAPNPDTFARSTRPWPGADNTNHYFSTQELFDPNKTSLSVPSFATRLLSVSTNVDTYDRYTFYRLLSQLGTDSAPEPAWKINLNYDNRVQPNVRGIVSATNFFAWRPVDFFTNAADMLLTNSGINLSLSSSNLQVYPTNFYTPSVHRLLQLAANIYDASTNRVFPGATNNFPSVFRPLFQSTAGKLGDEVYIVGYKEVKDTAVPLARPGMLDVNVRADRAALGPNRLNMVYGIPLIIGAKKGFPNFNEFSMATSVSVT